ncbi:E3 ubiquitin-protein ligase At4g11680-like isoform X2 [Carex rostrata]
MSSASIDLSSLLSGADRQRRTPLGGVARFLRRTRTAREPSTLIRESATDQLEDRQSGWAYSKPVVALDTLWNLAFVVVAGFLLYLSREEKPVVPLRLWVVGYAVQCIMHVVCVLAEYRRRVREGEGEEREDRRHADADYSLVPDLEMNRVYGNQQSQEITSSAKRLESANTLCSFIWWIIGFYWVSAGGQALTQNSPQLYWLCIVFLAFDVFFVVFCVALACVIGVAVCCCLPCIIAVLYAVADQQGASDEDICQLPKYKYRRVGGSDGAKMNGGVITKLGSDPPIEHTLSSENAECCICLSQYDDGMELRELPCTHHFHCACIDKWLHINATCPLCKYCIVKINNDEHV